MFWRRHRLPATWDETLLYVVRQCGAIRALQASAMGLSIGSEPEEDSPEIHRLAAVAGEFLNAPWWENTTADSQTIHAAQSIITILRCHESALAMEWEGTTVRIQRKAQGVVQELLQSPLRNRR